MSQKEEEYLICELLFCFERPSFPRRNPVVGLSFFFGSRCSSDDSNTLRSRNHPCLAFASARSSWRRCGTRVGRGNLSPRSSSWSHIPWLHKACHVLQPTLLIPNSEGRLKITAQAATKFGRLLVVWAGGIVGRSAHRDRM
jgi:hypothetical protein